MTTKVVVVDLLVPSRCYSSECTYFDKTPPKRQPSLLKFRKSISINFLTMFVTPSARGRLLHAQSDDIPYGGKNHLIEYETERKYKQCTKKAHFICSKFDIGLHSKECFKIYHTERIILSKVYVVHDVRYNGPAAFSGFNKKIISCFSMTCLHTSR